MGTKKNIYLDYAATTPLDDRVLKAMLPYFSDIFGNPSSVHSYGQKAEAALEEAREKVAHTLNCSTREVLFTSCGSESDNLALRGAAFAERNLRGANHILISPVEHHAISHTAKQLSDIFGFEVEFLSTDAYGMVDPEEVRNRLRADTAIVSVIYANNEIGTINPIAEIGAVCREAGVTFHTDAVQAAAYLPVDVQELNVDLMAIGAHKFYGPKGIGALYIRQGVPLIPILTGGGQEFAFRAGTHNIPYIVGLAESFVLAQSEREKRSARLKPMRDQIISYILEDIDESRLTGHPTQRLPNHASFVLKGVDGNALLMVLDAAGFACSSGSACKTGDPKPSEVLTALGFTPEWALGSLRITLGNGTISEDVQNFNDAFPQLVEKTRQLAIL